MKRFITFLLLFAALKVAGQTTGYLRFDTVKIMKQNGTCELYIINKTKDSLGLLTNVGGGLTQFIKSRSSGDSLFVGLDTIVMTGTDKLDSLHIYTAADPAPDTLYSYKNGDSTRVGLLTKGGALANNGLSLNGDTAQLGQLEGDVGNPAILTSSREIPMAGNDINLSGPGRLLIDTGRIVVGIQVDPLYPFSVKKVYDSVTQANFVSTVAKYPFYADKDVRFTEDSMSMWPIGGDNAGLSILRYKPRSILNLQNTVNRFTAHHAVLLLEKYPGFTDTTIFQGRASPLTGFAAPSGFAGIVSISNAGTSASAPNFSTGYFSALTAEWQIGGNAFNKIENAIWMHTGILNTSALAGSITNGYSLYINPLISAVTNKYAIYQPGTLDTNYFAGKIRYANLSVQNDSNLYKPTVSDTNGNQYVFDHWPVGSSGSGSSAYGIDSTVIGGTPGSVLFVGSDNSLQEDNAHLFYDSTNSGLTITKTLGVTQNTNSGFRSFNTTAATSGNQQMPPAVVWGGQGFATTPAASQPVVVTAELLPVQGASVASSIWKLRASQNGGAFVDILQVASSGILTTSGSTTVNGNLTVSSGATFSYSGRSIITSPANGNIRITDNTQANFGLLQFGGTTSSFPSIKRSTTNLQVRLADDSDFGGWETGALTTNSTVTLNNNPTGLATDLLLVKGADSVVKTIAASTFTTSTQVGDQISDSLAALPNNIQSLNSQTGPNQTLAAGTWMGIVSGSNNHTYSVNTTLVRADVDSRVKDSTGYYTATVITSDATPTDMFFFTVPTGQLTTVIAQCNAIRTADAEGGYIGYKSNNLIKHAGGGISTSTVRSILADEYTAGASALSTATFTIQADGTTGGKITFTGEAGTSIKCQCRVQLNYVNAGL